MKGTELGILVDEFNFSSAISQIDLQFEVGEADITNLDSTAQEFVPLLPKCTVSQNGYLVGVDAGLAEELEDRFGAGAAVVTVLTQKSDADCVAYVLPEAVDYSMVFGAPIAGVITLNGKWGTAAGARRGLRVYNGTFDAVENGAAVDFGVGGTNGGKAYLHVTSITGTAVGADIKVQSSPDNTTWSDEGTFTFSAVGGYSLALTGTVGRYIRLSCSDLGGASAIVCVGIVSLN